MVSLRAPYPPVATTWYDGIARRSGGADRLIAPEQMAADAPMRTYTTTEGLSLSGARPIADLNAVVQG